MIKFRLLIFLLTIATLCGCEGDIYGGGTVVSSVDDKPIDNVLIIWTNYFDSCRTDSNGHFSIGSFVGCVPECPQLQLFFSKDGYKNQYLNLSDTENFRQKEIIVKMQPTNILESTQIPFQSKFFFYLNILISIFNIATLIYLFTTNFKFKFLWAILIIFGSISFHYNFYSKDFNLEILNFLVQFSPKQSTGLVKIYLLIPLGSGIFWIYRRKINSLKNV